MCGAWVRKHLLLERITGSSSFWKALPGQEVEETLKEAETIKSFTYISLFQRSESETLGKWGIVEDWVRLRDIEIRVVVRARVVLLVSGSCW